MSLYHVRPMIYLFPKGKLALPWDWDDVPEDPSVTKSPVDRGEIFEIRAARLPSDMIFYRQLRLLNKHSS